MSEEKSTPTETHPPTAPRALAATSTSDLGVLDDMEVNVVVELGRHRFTLDEALELDEHSTLPLDHNADQPVDILVNGRLFARGEVVTVGDRFGVRLTQIIGQG